MKWNEIITTEDIKKLQMLFGGFHDSCLKELYLWTGSYVDDDLSMAMSSGTNVRILFQRQFENTSAIELMFEGVKQFHLSPSPEDYDSVIYGASLLIEDGLIYWADDSSWSPKKNIDYDVSWISSKGLRWRDVSSWIGEKMRYGIISEE
ncbi:hypothetical protein [Bacillus sp. AFS017336]|uniref:hypothetical protein n=1 Tax=Bacillus sp. AFS017336 TaxID=2033489 RepID=UPI000BEFA868|nr:hypothetical protein [Bacillus sp. AFS017336]PEL07729.1 hypothetical protein CN601_18715 [Bacillus sp. AFS017336]